MPENSDLNRTEMNIAFHRLGYAQYEWHTFGQPLGSQTVISLEHSATLMHNTQW